MATTIHVALLVLRKYRTAPNATFPLIVLPSLAFTASPWVWPTMYLVAASLALHTVWFLICETLIRPAVVSSPRPAATPAAGSPAGSSRANGHSAASSSAARPSVAAPSHDGKSGRDFVRVPVLAVFNEGEGVKTFRLERPADFTFEAGQFLAVRVQMDAAPHVRCYSISSAPEVPGYMEISVRRLGLVSGMLHATVRPGGSLFVKRPSGRFVYPSGDDRPIVLVAGGIGLTPLLSMLRHAVVVDPGRPVTLLWSTREQEAQLFADELHVIARRHPHVSMVHTLTRDSAGKDGRDGRIDAALIGNAVPDVRGAIYMLCGPVPMINALTTGLGELSVPAAQIRYEVFQPSAAVGATVSPVEAESAAQPVPATANGDHHITFARSAVTGTATRDRSLLEVAESTGVNIPSLCRAGVCGTCRTRVISGDIDCSSDTLDAADHEENIVLACVAWARSDVAVDA